MNAVVYYSNTGQSELVANYLAKETGFPALRVEDLSNLNYENLVLVFPVHCQRTPRVIRDFLGRISTEYLTPVATYGRMCYGNVLYEIQKQYGHKIAAAAYLPTKHTYLEGDTFSEFSRLLPLIKKIKNPNEIIIPKSYKNPFADFFPNLRSRLGVKMIRSSSCTDCGICTEGCPLKAIKNGHTNKKCIRCLRCVSNCTVKALSIKTRLPLRLYLKKKQIDKTVIYV